MIFEIRITGLDRKFDFRCENVDIYEAWVTALDLQIRESEGVKKALLAPPLKEFWRTEQITEEQFIKMADTFDVLLFRCNSTGGKITRFYTGSEFGNHLN